MKTRNRQTPKKYETLQEDFNQRDYLENPIDLVEQFNINKALAKRGIISRRS